MASDWIKMRADLFTHPKVFKIADSLGADELYIVGALLSFWAWAHAHAVDGRVDGATSHMIDRATRVDGLSAALVSVGWLHVDDDGVTIPRFEVHNGDSAKERTLKNERQSRWRERKRSKSVDAPVDGEASTSASTREEKRREDISTTDVVDTPARKRASPAAPVAKPDDVAEQTWADWLALRKVKRAPVTSTVLDGARKEADLAGMQLDAFLQVWCVRGSQGLQADWLKPAERQVASRVQQTFRERDAEAGIRRWEEMTGQRHPDRDRANGMVINATSTTPKLVETAQ